MLDNSWGEVNPEILAAEQRRLVEWRRTPSAWIKEVMALSKSVSPTTVAKRLHKARVKFVIIGAHAVAVHTRRPRTTVDVDVVVDDVPAAVAALRRMRAGTQLEDLGRTVGTRIVDRHGVELIDVLLPEGGVRGALFANCIETVVDGVTLYVPTLPAMLALKYISMFSMTRSLVRRSQDKTDFMAVLEANPEADIMQAARLLAAANPLLGRQMLHDVKEVRAGRDFKLYDLALLK